MPSLKDGLKTTKVPRAASTIHDQQRIRLDFSIYLSHATTGTSNLYGEMFARTLEAFRQIDYLEQNGGQNRLEKDLAQDGGSGDEEGDKGEEDPEEKLRLVTPWAVNQFPVTADKCDEVPDLQGKSYADFKLSKIDWVKIRKMHEVLRCLGASKDSAIFLQCSLPDGPGLAHSASP
ncbi:hypothetical protein C8R47DRAFT_1196475 [Mycena vitilis]|nr:hypothetical protein C8R47DRAFT_1196475 [Mycena vitilis]